MRPLVEPQSSPSESATELCEEPPGPAGWSASGGRGREVSRALAGQLSVLCIVVQCIVSSSVVLPVAALSAQSTVQRAQQHRPPSVGRAERRELDSVVEQAVEFFARSQRQNGSLGVRYSVAETSLAGLAMLAAGIQPGRGLDARSRVLDRCLSYILTLSDRNAYITEPEADAQTGSRMHGHCYAVLFLTQIHGSVSVEQEKRVRLAIRRGIQVIERSQSRLGGWYYWSHNRTNQDEASVTICALQALRAARNSGFVVSSTAVQSALRYIKMSQEPRTGGVIYSLSQNDRRTTFSLTAAAVSTLNAAGVYESPELRKGLDYLTRQLDQKRFRNRPADAVDSNWFYYGNFYAAQAFFQQNGPRWKRWYPLVRKQLLARRKGDRWESSYGEVYATAMALLVLEMPLGYLPIFQR